MFRRESKLGVKKGFQFASTTRTLPFAESHWIRKLANRSTRLSTSEHYDVLVIGRSVAGLLAASLLAKRRFRVRVYDVDTDNRVQNLPLFGMKTAPIWPKLMEELGLVHTMRTQIKGERGLGVALKDRRFILHSDRVDRGRELSECFPEDTDGLLALFEHASTQGPLLTPLLEGEVEGPPVSFGSRRKWQKQVELHQLSATQNTPAFNPEILEEFFSATLALGGQFGVSPQTATPSQWRSFWHLCHGETILNGGRERLEDILIEKLESSGGVFETRKTVHQLEVRRRKIRGAHLSGGGFVGAEHYVLAHGGSALESLVDEWTPAETRFAWMTGTMRTCQTLECAPYVGWSLAEKRSAASCLSGGEYWLATQTTTPTVQPADVFGPLLYQAKTHGEATMPSSERIDDFGLYHDGLEAPFKNSYCVGHWVMPGLGLEADGLTAWQTAQAITRSATSFWKSGPKR